MDLQHQHLVDQLVSQYADDFAYLHYELRLAIPEAGDMWAHLYDRPIDVHGTTFGSCVRQRMIGFFDAHRVTADGHSGQEPVIAYNKAAFPALTPRPPGPNCSVRLVVPGGKLIRVRKWPASDLKHRTRLVAAPHPDQPEAAAKARQWALNEQPEAEGWPEVPPEGIADLFVLWWPTDDTAALQGAALALASDLDESTAIRIYATADLPPARKRPSTVQPAQPVSATQDAALEDFEDLFDEKSSGAGGTTSA